MTPLHCALEGAAEAQPQLVTEQSIETHANVDTTIVPVSIEEEHLQWGKVAKLVLDNKS